MTNYPFQIRVKARSKTEATQKLKAAGRLIAALDNPTLQALADRGPGMLRGPRGGLIRAYLGLE